MHRKDRIIKILFFFLQKKIKGREHMDKKKQIDLIRKRNCSLSEELENLKLKMDFDRELNGQGYEDVKSLVSDLENIKTEWEQSLSELKVSQAKYDCLVSDLKTIRNEMLKGIKIAWYKKLLFKFKK